MPVDIDIDHVARLARLDLNGRGEGASTYPVERDPRARGHWSGEVAADDVPPTAWAIPRSNVFRDDVPEPGLSQAAALA